MLKNKTAMTLSKFFTALAGIYAVSFKFGLGSPEVPEELKKRV
ncbi:cyclic lactone autoinducer peptide [Brevibacillus laterosporus]|nr:cyclic lactone autoinducer peptide [Brevibacillus laterosporus]